jgi:hypothetical protein
VFWSVFAGVLIVGLATSWRPGGRQALRSCGAFVAALWRDAMRNPTSVPARYACIWSGRLLRVSPPAAAFVYRHPEVPLAIGALLLIGIIGGSVWLCWSWV